jgi:hypothetical protein
LSKDSRRLLEDGFCTGHALGPERRFALPRLDRWLSIDLSVAELDTFERLTKNAQDAASRLHVRSALNPLLWLCGICSPITLLLAFFSSGAPQVALLIIASVPIVCTCAAYFYFMVREPNRLHSEDYQLRQQALEMIYEKGARGGIYATSIIAITNPDVRRLPEETD